MVLEAAHGQKISANDQLAVSLQCEAGRLDMPFRDVRDAAQWFKSEVDRPIVVQSSESGTVHAVHGGEFAGDHDFAVWLHEDFGDAWTDSRDRHVETLVTRSVRMQLHERAVPAHENWPVTIDDMDRIHHERNSTSKKCAIYCSISVESREVSAGFAGQVGE